VGDVAIRKYCIKEKILTNGVKFPDFKPEKAFKIFELTDWINYYVGKYLYSILINITRAFER